MSTPDATEPAYQQLNEPGELADRAAAAWRQLRDCDLCARYCHVDRLRTSKGAVCRTGARAVVHSYGPHHGEEDPPPIHTCSHRSCRRSTAPFRPF